MSTRRNQCLRVMSVIIFLAAQTGCASLVSGMTQDMVIRSAPSGARVEIDGRDEGKTPYYTDLERRRRHQIRIKKEGYGEESQATHKGFNAWSLGNILFGGLIGMIIDFATGAIYSVSPNEMNFNLTAKQKAAPPAVPAQEMALPQPVNKPAISSPLPETVEIEVDLNSLSASSEPVQLKLHTGKVLKGRILDAGSSDIFLDTAQGMMNVSRSDIVGATQVVPVQKNENNPQP